ncbi:Hypothetical predicted protein, partial [Paramuricea clavata]
MRASSALDQSLLDALANMRGEEAETAQTRLKKKRLDFQPGKSISKNLSTESDESDEESEEDSKTEEESESQPGTDEETLLQGECDTDTPSTSTLLSQKEKLLQTLSEVNKLLDDDMKGRLYAVYYGQKYYWGKNQLCFVDDQDEDAKSVEFYSFLRYRGDSCWDFPKKSDVEIVEAKYIFCGSYSSETTIAEK